jgi:capsid protein
MPNLIDKVVGYFSPGAGIKRVVARQAYESSYRGGVPTRTSEGWGRVEGFQFGSSIDRSQLTNARDRAYQAYRNNPVARTLVNTETDNVIGDGLNFQPTTDSEEWNREATDRYYAWLEEASIRGQDIQTGSEIQRLAWSRSRIAGDVGWILVARGSDSYVQLVPSENIATPDGMQSAAGMYDGIQFDAMGKPVTYYVKYTDERGLRKFVPVEARDFVYLAHHSEPSQARGETCFMTIFDLLSHLDRYVDGVSLAAWMATVFGIIFKDNSAARQVSGLPTLTNSQGNQQRAITLENGMVKYMAPEGEVVQVDAKQPMQQTPAFIRRCSG